MDEFDRRLLRALQQDATQSMDALAEMVGLSRNACWRRLRGLEQAGVIRARVALLDPDAVGLGLLAFVSVRAGAHEADWAARFAAAVRRLPNVIAAHRMAGEVDYLLQVRVDSLAEYDRVYQALTSAVPLSDVTASFVMDTLKDGTALPL